MDSILKTIGQRAFGGGVSAKRPLSPAGASASSKKSAAGPSSSQNGLFQDHLTDKSQNGLFQDQPTNTTTGPPGKPPRIPTLFVDGATDWEKLCSELDSRLAANYTVRSRGNCFRLTTTTVPDFRAAQKFLLLAKVPFHTFSVGRPQNLRVVISGLPSTMTDVKLVDALGAQNFAVEDAVRLRTSRGPTNSWLVTLCPDGEDEDARRAADIYSLTTLLRLQVRVTQYRRPAGPTQCHRCQGIGHGSQNCGRPQRCVRCGGPHTGSQCQKPRGEVGQCCNCDGRHNANYRGCPHYQRAKARARGLSRLPAATAAKAASAPPPSAPDEVAETTETEVPAPQRKRRKRPPRNPANRRTAPPRPREEEPPAGPRQRSTQRRRLDWPPGPPREMKQRPVPADAPEEAAAILPNQPDLLAALAEVLRQLTALTGIITSLAEAQRSAAKQ